MKRDLEERLSHARYEYRMARYCVGQLWREQTQLQWNVLLAAFAVYFRNLEKHFLKGDGDQQSIKAKNYMNNGRFNPTSAADLEPEVAQLHEQILHLSGKRTSETDRKLGTEKAVRLMRWLDENMEKFERELPDRFKAVWNERPPLDAKLFALQERTASNEVADTSVKTVLPSVEWGGG
jgi:hypothetical protein